MFSAALRMARNCCWITFNIVAESMSDSFTVVLVMHKAWGVKYHREDVEVFAEPQSMLMGR